MWRLPPGATASRFSVLGQIQSSEPDLLISARSAPLDRIRCAALDRVQACLPSPNGSHCLLRLSGGTICSAVAVFVEPRQYRRGSTNTATD